MDDERAPAPAPALRASDKDRERTADLLRHAAGDGRLTLDELDERMQRLHRELHGPSGHGRMVAV